MVVKNIIEELVLPDRFGASQRPFVISGPCSAESREQVLETARQLSAIGKVHLFRAGIWKPRTRPHTFEGKGAEALQWLSEVKEETGLPVATEVANAAHVESSLKANLDVLWIGARTTVSPFAVQEIADALEGTKIPVIVKNPIHADLKLWMGAIERVVQKVGGPVWALHRGFSSYGLKEFRNAPMWEIPIGLRAEMPEIPLLCDPSHISGNQTLISSVAQKAMDLGMHGLMIESHSNPQEALSDAQQQVTPEHLSQLLDDLMIRDASANPEQLNGLEAMRLQMDSLDEQLIELLHGRMDLARSIGRFKSEHGMTILQLERWQEVMKTRSNWGQSLNLGKEFTSKLLEQLHKESIRVQNEEMIKKNNSPKEL